MGAVRLTLPGVNTNGKYKDVMRGTLCSPVAGRPIFHYLI